MWKSLCSVEKTSLFCHASNVALGMKLSLRAMLACWRYGCGLKQRISYLNKTVPVTDKNFSDDVASMDVYITETWKINDVLKDRPCESHSAAEWKLIFCCPVLRCLKKYLFGNVSVSLLSRNCVTTVWRGGKRSKSGSRGTSSAQYSLQLKNCCEQSIKC